jgi:hypothetical protein
MVWGAGVDRLLLGAHQEAHDGPHFGAVHHLLSRPEEKPAAARTRTFSVASSSVVLVFESDFDEVPAE